VRKEQEEPLVIVFPMAVVGDARNLGARRELREGPSTAKHMVVVGDASILAVRRVLKAALTTA